MKITGSAPAIAIPTFLYFFLMVIIDSYTQHAFRITENYYGTLAAIAAIMILTGVVGVAASARKLLKCFKQRVLITDGPYRICRNPMYASYVFFVIPGLCLLFNSWLVLTTVIVNFSLTLIFVPREYAYLEETFGDEYRTYLKSVWIKFI
ncbi:MAG: methyltransferase family protein [Syntrophomonadaceae bacterium]